MPNPIVSGHDNFYKWTYNDKDKNIRRYVTGNAKIKPHLCIVQFVI